MRRRPLNIVDCGLLIGAFQGVGRNLVLFKAKAANLCFSRRRPQTGAVEGAGRKIQISNAEGVHINFRHFRHFLLLMTKDEAQHRRWTFYEAVKG